jgi:hypothetical protein
MTESFERTNTKRVLEMARKLGADATAQARRRPQLAIGVALAVGFVAGSVLGTRLGQVLVAGAAGYLIKHVLLGDSALEELRRSLERIVDGTGGEPREPESARAPG